MKFIVQATVRQYAPLYYDVLFNEQTLVIYLEIERENLLYIKGNMIYMGDLACWGSVDRRNIHPQ